MLGLLVPTDASWADAAARDLPGLLSDHAHCELKAAQSALSLVARFGGEHPALVAPLVALAHEETEHFAEVQAQLARTGGTLGKPSSDAYVVALRDAARADGEAPALLDRLIVAALVEARSCERFKLLSENLEDPTLKTFYRGLMAAEARHFRLFTDLAESFFPQLARARLNAVATREAEVVRHLPLGPTVHG